MKIDIVDTDNQKVDEMELDDSVFGAVVRPHLFWEVVKQQLASRRAGTHSTKTVAEVAGSGAKPYKQKGTGRARHGASRAMNMRGGGVVHGPRPRDYSYKLPKKMVRAALRSALSKRAADGRVIVVRGWAPAAPKTKEARGVLQALGANKALVVGKADNKTLQRSLRNLTDSAFLSDAGLNVYDILKYDYLILDEAVARELNERLETEPSRKERALKEAVSHA